MTGRREPVGDLRGFSIIEMLTTVALLGVLTSLAVPQFIEATDRARQRRSLAEMRSLAGANASFRLDDGDFANTLDDLSPGYIDPLPLGDGWGNPWTYSRNGEDYWLTSPGRDGVGGPAPPDPWYGEPFEVDLVVRSGAFSQAPRAKR